MKKLVVKTSLITLATIVGAVIIAFFSLWIFSPKTLANVFDGVGAYSASLYFYEQNYNKTEDIRDLALLVDELIKNEDNENLETYSKKLISDNGFYNYCLVQDRTYLDAITTKEYYTGVYAIALINNGKLETAITFMSDCVGEDGYTDYNPFRTVIYEFKNDDSVLRSCAIAITAELTNLAGDEALLALSDVNDINYLLAK